MEKEAIKSLIELSDTFEEADEVIETYTQFKTPKEKIAYLSGMFDVAILASAGDDDVESDYRAILSTIINQKWR